MVNAGGNYSRKLALLQADATRCGGVSGFL
jgi:hypothetical protein